MIVSDSPIHMGFLYASDMVDYSDAKQVMLFNDIFKTLTKLNHPKPRYDYIFHLPPILQPVDDGVRLKKYLDQDWREEANRRILTLFEIFKPKSFKIIEEIDLDKRSNIIIDELKKI